MFKVKNKEFLVLCIAIMIFNLSYSILVPILPDFFSRKGMTTLTIGYVMSAYAISKSVSQLPSGIIADLVGHKKVLNIGLLLISIILFIYSKVDKALTISVIYIIEGAVAGMTAPSIYSILSRIISEEKRGQYIGTFSALSSLGIAIGPLISGVVMKVFDNYNLAFYIACFGGLVSSILVFFLVKIEKNNENLYCIEEGKVKENRKTKNILNEVKDRKNILRIVMIGVLAFLGDFIYGSMVSVFPIYGEKVLDTSIIFTSLIISINFFIFSFSAPIAGIISDKIGAKKQVLYSLVIMGTAFLTVSFIRNSVIFTIIIVSEFFAGACMYCALQSLLCKVAKNSEASGIIYGISGTFQSIGLALGPVFSAIIFEYRNEYFFRGLFFITGIVLIIFIYSNKYTTPLNK